VAQHERAAFDGADICEPIPREHVLGRHDEIVAVRGDDLEEHLRRRFHSAVHERGPKTSRAVASEPGALETNGHVTPSRILDVFDVAFLGQCQRTVCADEWTLCVLEACIALTLAGQREDLCEALSGFDPQSWNRLSP
jgi:hypothetical protein